MVRPVPRCISSLEEGWREQAWDALLRGEGYPPRPIVIEGDNVARRPAKPHWSVGAMFAVILALSAVHAVAVFMSGRAQAENDAPAMVAYPGRCQSLTLFGQLPARRCADSIATLALPGGRTGFAITMEGGGIVSLTAPASGRSTIEKRTVLALDRVDFVFHGESEQIGAQGRCEAEDPTVHGASITCDATTPEGQVTFRFFSAGGPGTALNQ